jgi:DNA-binding CsgD family transcriptional regulator
VDTVVARLGLVVVDASLNLLASNPEATQILTYPDQPESGHLLEALVIKRIRSRLGDRKSLTQAGFVGEFVSARRTYLCRSFPLNLAFNGHESRDPTTVLILERKRNGASTVEEISKRFGLTRREHETVQLLFQGLTSKEIAERMSISANTVKAFIRLVMIKMNVSTRSGIVGKIVEPRS